MATLNYVTKQYLKRVEQAASCRARPTFSLFATDTNGNYKLVSVHTSPKSVVESFQEASNYHDGLEIRCDGKRVNLDD